ncbi:fasciclin-like arabinogalactan protein 3 [Gastrolobium bilobum]|uniref:fasciclin-like arabinogalactan protein 3 n=1 Tax=Gastrolobium bilobum TaxID=150636 RepID=UPI002AAFDDCC|nr:fasciclin-like arabinogalactan protein 3 [Gastrolobium bilobum]
MGSKSSSLLYLALLLAFSSAIHAFDITKLLGQYPEYSTFNKYLTETKLADDINKRNTITVLVVDNAGLSSISGKSSQAIKAIISTNVVLDYFDEKKLMEALGSNEQLTTLYQASGLATNQQGFLKVAQVGEGNLAFGSAASGAPADAELVKTVTSEPFNISILQVTKPIIAPGVDTPVPSSSEAKAPASAQSAKSPVPAKSAEAPTPSETTPASSPSESVVADSPTEAAEAPETTVPGPTVSEAPALAPGPVGDEAAADTPASGSSSFTKMGLVGAVMGFASLLFVL